MQVCVAASVATALIWLVWVWAVRHPARSRMTAFLLLAHAAMLLVRGGGWQGKQVRASLS